MGGGAGTTACGQTHHEFEVTITPSDFNSGPPCSAVGWERTGRVVKTSENWFSLDTCAPTADCTATYTDVGVAAEGLKLWVPHEAFVTVKYSRGTCWENLAERLSVRNVANWDGTTNPVSQKSNLYLAATDGVADHAEAPFSVSYLPLGCGSGEPSCEGLKADDHVFVFTVGPGDPGTKVSMGQTITLVSPDPMDVHNLRSYRSGNCNDDWNWAWWATWAPTLSGAK
jgi:hypothetical protein